MELMAEKWVPIARFRNLSEAHIVRSRLEADGIPCFLADENMGWLYTAALGGLTLKVPESQKDAAAKILQLAQLRVLTPDSPPAGRRRSAWRRWFDRWFGPGQMPGNPDPDSREDE